MLYKCCIRQGVWRRKPDLQAELYMTAAAAAPAGAAVPGCGAPAGHRVSQPDSGGGAQQGSSVAAPHSLPVHGAAGPQYEGPE